MRLPDAMKLAYRLMAEHGLDKPGPHGRTPWKFKFDGAVRRFGLTNYRTHTISLSTALTRLNDQKHVEDTILHEIAHALVGSNNGHNYIWQEKALEIGADGRRLYNSSEVKTPPKKYKGVCPGCKREVFYNRTGTRSCGKCWPSYNKKYQFIWSLNK